MLLAIAFLLVIGFKIWGVTGKNTSVKAEFLLADSGQKSECFVGILDAERSVTNLAAKHFTCADSVRFLFENGGTYTSPADGYGVGFKIVIPAGWAVEEWPAGNENDLWLAFSQFSKRAEKSFEISGQQSTVSAKDGAAKTFDELKKAFPSYSASSVGGFETLNGNSELVIFVGPKMYWQFSPAPEFAGTMEKISK